MRLLRVAPARQTALDLGTATAVPGSGGAVGEWGWWQLPESARAEVIAILSRLIARGVLVEDPPTGPTALEPSLVPVTGPSGPVGPAGAGSGEAGE